MFAVFLYTVGGFAESANRMGNAHVSENTRTGTNRHKATAAVKIGRAEMVHAFRRLAAEGKGADDITEEDIAHAVYTHKPPQRRLRE